MFNFDMVFWFFKKRDAHAHKRIDEMHEILKNSFSNLKNDMNHVSDWMKYSKKKDTDDDKKLDNLNSRLDELEQLFGQLQTDIRSKQTSVHVQTPVQTGVQTQKASKKDYYDGLEVALRNLTTMERTVVWMLLNTDLKMSYDDMCVALGKDKSTLRGQINNIKQKAEGLVSEFSEPNGKKRFYINDELREHLLSEFTKTPKSEKGEECVEEEGQNSLLY